MSDRNSENLGGNRGYGAISGSEVGREGPGGGSASSGPVKWGPAIAVDGQRPGWLCSGEWRRVRSLAVGEWQTADVESPGDTIPDMDEWNWGDITAIRLPADHPHYFVRKTDEAPIDWSGELEAVHEDGRVRKAVLAYDRDESSYREVRIEGEFYQNTKQAYSFYEDGRRVFKRDWRIRNVPQPTPQADTKPDLRAAAIGVANSARNGIGQCLSDEDVVDQIAATLDLVSKTTSDPTAEAAKAIDELFNDAWNEHGPQGYGRDTVGMKAIGDVLSELQAKVRAILLPDPVDPDLIEAREMEAEACEANGFPEYAAKVRAGEEDNGTVRLRYEGIKRGRALALAGEKEA